MTRRTRQAAVMAACAALLAVCIAGCQLVSAPRRHGRQVAAAGRPPALLVLVLASATSSARAALRAAVTGSAQFGERLIVVGPSGATLGSFAAPAPPEMTGPVFPAALPADATSFQRSAYRTSEASAQTALRHDREILARHADALLRSWTAGAASRSVAMLARAPAGRPSLTRAVSAAIAAVTALRQDGLAVGDREVLAIIGAGARPVPLAASLAGLTVAATVAGDGGGDAAWQADLLAANASRAYVLPPALGGMLPGLIAGGLAGHDGVPFVLTGFRYGPAQYRLPPAATPSLRRLLRLLTITYPAATASINGYTDDVPVPGGNLALSRRRADAVLDWLVAHGVAATRLQAVGHGAAGPQPADRRVVVIVSPPA